MELHRSAAQPDWAHVPPDKQNLWQRIAGRTHGIVTPGNIASVVGAALVLIGLLDIAAGHFWRSLILIAVGRLLDILDGIIANRTGTKSSLGEAFDATCDKICAFATIYIFATQGVLWWPAALILGLQNSANTVIGLIAKKRKYDLHPLAVGKVSTAGEWTALLGLGLVAALELSQSSALGVVAYTTLALSLGLGMYATARYLQMFLRTRSRS
jgi:phosphatidylglycerophosphate synthase